MVRFLLYSGHENLLMEREWDPGSAKKGSA